MAYHVAGGTRAREEHVAGNLAEDVADKEDGHACLVLGVGELEVFLKIVEAGQGDGIAVCVMSEDEGSTRRRETYQDS